jgi:hypothetical protein
MYQSFLTVFTAGPGKAILIFIGPILQHEKVYLHENNAELCMSILIIIYVFPQEEIG